MTCDSWSGVYVFFFKQKTAYEMRISDWSSDVCSSDLLPDIKLGLHQHQRHRQAKARQRLRQRDDVRTDAGGLEAEERAGAAAAEIGRASCRERVCQYV